MKRKGLLFTILLIILSSTVAGCTGEHNGNKDFNIPEAEKIQKLLDDMSTAVMENNFEGISRVISHDCPRRSLELEKLKKLMDDARLEDYSQNIITAKRLRDGVVCTVSISSKGVAGNESFSSRSVRNMYFVFEKVEWKIGDYNYYPYVNPTVIVGSESLLYDSAYIMSEVLNSRLRTDTEHLQAFGDIILVGTPYDNASILDLEEKGLTAVKVTEDYPGDGLGIVQVLANIEDYRFVILIQGSTSRVAENSVRFMADYLRDNPYMNPGVYFIEEDALRSASPLETSTLVTLDMVKSSQRLKEVQKHMEANTKVMEEELRSEREQLVRDQSYLDNPYRADYYKVFSRYGYYPEKSLYDSMVLINANFTDSRLCTSAFLLPYGSSSGTAYAFADYVNRSISLSADKESSAEGLLIKNNDERVHSAHEIYDSANQLEVSGLGTALLRLADFSTDEVYSATADNGSYLFLNVDEGYGASPGNPLLYSPELPLSSGDMMYLYNDGAFLNYENNNTNLEVDDVSAINDRIKDVFTKSGQPPRKAPAKVPFGKSELSEKSGISSDTEDIYSLLRNTFVMDDTPCLYSTLDEAREKLRESMGRLLAIKCTRYLVNGASRYPASQFDYARYAAGLINVENPGVYAEASESSRLVKDLSGGISNLLSDSPEKYQKIVDILKDIAEEERSPDMFFFPDHCIANKSGSHWDKALMAFGLYSRITGSTEAAYIALGENSSYLIFNQEDRWKYLDCKYNEIKDVIDDDIYAVFNKDFVYNDKLGIGDKPDFVR